MGRLDEVRERLRTNATFRERVLAEPSAALAAYDLTGADLIVLADDLEDDRRAGDPRGLELFVGEPPAPTSDPTDSRGVTDFTPSE